METPIDSLTAAMKNLSGHGSTFKVTMDCYGKEPHSQDITGPKKLKGFKSHPEAGPMHFELVITQKRREQ